MIKKIGNKFRVVSHKTGRNMGTYPTKKLAVKRLKNTSTIRFTAIFLFLMMFSIATVSATDWTKSTEYSENDLKVTFNNWWGLGGEEGSLTLKSHPSINYVKKVTTGWQVTMYYDFNFKEEISNGLGDVEFIDMKTGKLVDKQWRYVYWHEEFQDKDITETNCIEGKEIEGTKNGTKEMTCETKVIGKEKVLIDSGWREYNSKTIPLNMRIGIEVYSEVGDKIDGVWNIGSKRLDRHAEWTVANCGTGGTVTFDGDFCINTFTTNGTFNAPKEITNVSMLIVAGGGAGGGSHGGGGGAGGLTYQTGLTLSSGNYVTIVGKGGDAVLGAETGIVRNGTNSSFGTNISLNVLGGGGGGRRDGTGSTTIGQYGGSGGGGAGTNPTTAGSGLSPQGYNGGAGSSDALAGNGGGGGGANGTGTAGIGVQGGTSGSGGAGFNTTINGTNSCFAGGGSGGLWESGTAGTVTCGGGAGSAGDGNSGVNGTGGGGGGKGSEGSGSSGAGGSGIVILRYPVFSAIGIVLISPNEGLIIDSPVTFQVNISESSTITIKNVSLLINETINQTNTSQAEGIYEWNININSGHYNWTVTAYDTDNFVYTASNGTFTFEVDATTPTIAINSGNGTQNYGSLTQNHTINFTVTDTNLDDVWYNYNGTNRTITGAVSGVMNSTSFPLVLNLYNATVYANDTAGNLQTQVVSWDYNLFENSQSYSSTTTSGSSETFIVNFTFSSAFSGISATLNYDDTNYTLTTNNTGYTRSYYTNLIIPSVTSQENKTFNFIVALSNSSGTYYIETSDRNQTVNPFVIDNCSTYTQNLFNFTMYDEGTLEKINGTINVNLNVYSYQTTDLVNTYNKTFNYLSTGSSGICLGNITQNYSVGYTIQYYGNDTTYYKRFKSIQRMTINNESLNQTIELYNLKIASGYPFRIIVVGNLLSSTGNTNLLVDAQRQYLAEDKFRSVESYVTDSEGETILHLIQNDEVYNFIVSYMGEVIGSFNNYRVQCENSALLQCTLRLNLASVTSGVTDFEDYGNIAQTFLFDNETRTLYQTFSSTDGETKTVRQTVLELDGYGNNTICNNSASGTSGTIICTIPGVYQDTNFMVETYVGDEYIGTKLFSQGVDIDWMGVDMIIMLLMFTSLVLLFIGHPILIVIGAMMGFILPIVLIYITSASFMAIFGSIIYYIALGVILWVVLGRKL